jgi:secreted Zn-dependent insulinase-like peptidase
LKKTQLVQSPADHRRYQALTLNNGLRVLLVEQTDAEKSAAAMSVNVGHFDDPADREGLAHFLEHLVFLGSEKFPEAGEYAQFISSHGGSHNAWTGTEHSCFYFDIEDNAFAAGLERFADMLGAPLFAEASVQKERQAIEAEFSMKLKDDGRRIYQAHKETINPDHPFAKFSVGNLQTLDDRPHQSARDAVRQFYQQQYAASRMCLVLVSALPLAEQQSLAEQYFNQIPAHLPAKTSLTAPLYKDEHLGIQLNIQPHKPTQRLVLSFALPDIQPWYPYKVVSFLAHLIGDEGPGSLLSGLKQQGLVNALSAGGGIDGSNYKDFTLAFELTHAGMTQRDLILQSCFAYFALLRQEAFPLYLFQERQRLIQWSFTYQEPRASLQLASDLAINLQHYPEHDYIFGDYRMETPSESLYRQLLSYFRADNLRVMLIAPEVSTSRQARWYHTPYSVEPLAAELLTSLATQQPMPGYRLPEPNPYLVGQLQLIPLSAHQHQPEHLVDTEHLSLWFKADTDFHSPKGHVFVQLTLPNTVQDLTQLALTKLWLELFLDRINEQFYPATTAGLSYNLYVQQHGLTLHTSGLSANQIALLQDLLGELTDLQFSEQRFAELQFQLVRHWRSQISGKPISQLFSQLSSLLQPLNPDTQQLAQLLEQTDFACFNRFCASTLQQVHIDALMLGNWLKTDAHLLERMLTQWQQQLNSPGQRLPRQSYSVQGSGPVWLAQQLAHDDQALVIYLPAKDRSAAAMAKFMLANHLISPEYFHALRTEQQLGYLVGTGYVPMNLKPGMAFYVQSPKTAAADLYYATVIFYRKFLEELPEIPPEDFQQIKSSLIAQIRERDTSLASRAKRLWLAIGQGDYQCSLSQRIQDELEALSLADFCSFCYELLAPDYDAIFMATGPAPEHSLMRTMSAAELASQLALQTDWL